MKAIRNIIIVNLSCLALMTACKKPMEEITTVDYPRAFAPVEIRNEDVKFDSTHIRWRSIDNATHYVLELSTDTTPTFDPTLTIRTDTVEGTSLPIGGLFGEKPYSVRIKALSFRAGQEESKWAIYKWTTPAEQIFELIKDVDIKGTSLTAYYTVPDGNVTHIFVNGERQDITDVEIGVMKTFALTGLTSNTTYTIQIWDGDDRKRGELTPTTKKMIGDFPNAVQINIGDNLASICSDEANIGKVLYLPDGFVYDATTNPGITLAGTMTFYGDPDAVTKPAITFTNATAGGRLFAYRPNCQIDEIRFENLSLSATSSTNDLVVFQTVAGPGTEDLDSLNAIVFENCEISNFGRGLIRFQRTEGQAYNHKAVGLLSMNNCVATNCSQATYKFIHANVNKESITEIKITNSTFSGSKTGLAHLALDSKFPDVDPICKSITVENCTFNDFVSNREEYLIDGNGNTEVAITVRNVIFGQFNATMSGYRVGEGGSVSTQNCYSTSDYLVPAVKNFPDIIAYPQASTALFENPASGDFHIKATDFAGKRSAGDPRWR